MKKMVQKPKVIKKNLKHQIQVSKENKEELIYQNQVSQKIIQIPSLARFTMENQFSLKILNYLKLSVKGLLDVFLKL